MDNKLEKLKNRHLAKLLARVDDCDCLDEIKANIKRQFRFFTEDIESENKVKESENVEKIHRHGQI